MSDRMIACEVCFNPVEENKHPEDPFYYHCPVCRKGRAVVKKTKEELEALRKEHEEKTKR